MNLIQKLSIAAIAPVILTACLSGGPPKEMVMEAAKEEVKGAIKAMNSFASLGSMFTGKKVEETSPEETLKRMKFEGCVSTEKEATYECSVYVELPVGKDIKKGMLVTQYTKRGENWTRNGSRMDDIAK